MEKILYIKKLWGKHVRGNYPLFHVTFDRRRSLFTNFSKPTPAHVNIQVQYYTKQNVTRGIHTTYIKGKCIPI